MKKLKAVACLKSYDVSENLLDELVVSIHFYYDQSVEMIDSAEFRRKSKITRIAGQLFDSQGVLVQEFENRYGADGGFLSSTVKHSDGTIVES